MFSLDPGLFAVSTKTRSRPLLSVLGCLVGGKERRGMGERGERGLAHTDWFLHILRGHDLYSIHKASVLETLLLGFLATLFSLRLLKKYAGEICWGTAESWGGVVLKKCLDCFCTCICTSLIRTSGDLFFPVSDKIN